MKLSKAQAKLHNQAVEITQQAELSHDEKIFVLENYHEGATNINGTAGAFFTPLSLGRSFNLETYSDKNVIDLCAGIGHLTWQMQRQAEIEGRTAKFTCVEINPEYYEIGKKIIPHADWYLADVTDKFFWDELMTGEKFSQAISNPPFGNIKTGVNTMPLKYTGAQFEFKVVEIATIVADCGTFILPQMSTPFKYSGAAEKDGYYAKKGRSDKYDRFSHATGIEFAFNMGIDAKTDEWKGVSPTCEIVNWEGIHKD